MFNIKIIMISNISNIRRKLKMKKKRKILLRNLFLSGRVHIVKIVIRQLLPAALFVDGGSVIRIAELALISSNI